MANVIPGGCHPDATHFPPFRAAAPLSLLTLVARFSRFTQLLSAGSGALLLAAADDLHLAFGAGALLAVSLALFFAFAPPAAPLGARRAALYLLLPVLAPAALPPRAAPALLLLAAAQPWPFPSRLAAAAASALLCGSAPAARAPALLALLCALFYLLPAARRRLSGRARALLAAAHVGGAAALLRAHPAPPAAAAALLAAAACVPLLGAPAVWAAQAWRVDASGPWDLPKGAPPEEEEEGADW